MESNFATSKKLKEIKLWRGLKEMKSKINTKKIAFIILVICVLVFIITFSCLSMLVFNRYSRGVLPNGEDLLKAKVYEHVVIFGVDGAGGYISQCETPNFDRIFNTGSITHEAISQYTTNSAENWTSSMHGVRYQKHKVNNEVASSRPYNNYKYPSYFKAYAEINPNATFASIVNWTPINKGIVEDGIPNMTKIAAEAYCGMSYDSFDIDKQVSLIASTRLEEKEDSIVFLHYDSVDHMGHAYGWGSVQYENALKKIDEYIGIVYDAYVNRGWGNNTLFILMADHGMSNHGNHGINISKVRKVTVAVNGGLGNVIQGSPKHVVTQDVASIVMYALGVKQPKSWESRVPYNMFNTL